MNNRILIKIVRISPRGPHHKTVNLCNLYNKATLIESHYP